MWQEGWQKKSAWNKARAWGLAHNYSGVLGGWIYKDGPKPVCQGWLRLYELFSTQIEGWGRRRAKDRDFVRLVVLCKGRVIADGPILTVANGRGNVLDFSPTARGSARYRALRRLRAHQIESARYAAHVEAFK